MRAVFWKEMADYLGSRRFLVLFALVALSGLWAAFVVARSLRAQVESVPTEFVYLLLLTTGSGLLPSFVTFLGFFGPLLGLALGFDAISGERSRGTLSRVLSQPVYRDAVINGKFLAGLATLGVMLASMFLILNGLGMWMLGFPPEVSEISRMSLFLLVTLIYIAFYLGLSMLFSVLVDRSVLSALLSIGLWLFFSFFIVMVAGSVADLVVREVATTEQAMRFAEVEQMVMRLSPTALYQEASIPLLSPVVRSLGLVEVTQLIGALPNPLPLGQSVLLMWPHLVALFALTAACFAISYIRFMRQEIRA